MDNTPLLPEFDGDKRTRDPFFPYLTVEKCEEWAAREERKRNEQEAERELQ